MLMKLQNVSLKIHVQKIDFSSRNVLLFMACVWNWNLALVYKTRGKKLPEIFIAWGGFFELIFVIVSSFIRFVYDFA